jgi:hypothetical protein
VVVGVVGERGGQELESSSLCLRVAVAGGARWAKMTEWVVSLPSSCCLPARWDHVRIVYCSESFDLAQIK